MKVVLWNTEWAVPGSIREQTIRRIIQAETPDVVCVTEGYRQSWQQSGFLACSEADYGYRQIYGRRKVLLWSTSMWESVDSRGSDSMPSGRFVSGVTYGLKFMGVCIPWKDAHVRTGRKDRRAWEDHCSYLDGLAEMMGQRRNQPTLLLGDFNQRIPDSRAPMEVYRKLRDVLGKDLWIATEGFLPPVGVSTIDHICFSPRPRTFKARTLDAESEGVRLSDHHGIVAEFEH